MIEVTISDWQKFNPRTDSKNHTWFRFENAFFTKTFSWKSEEQRLFSYLCCICSQEKKTTFNFDMDLASALLKRKPKQISHDLESLRKRGVVTLSNFKLPEVTPSQLVPTNVRTNERTILSEFDFEAIYQSYPKKEGKTKGIEICRSRITTTEDYTLLLRAVNNYARLCREERKEKKFIKMFSSFMSVWRDYALDDPKPQINVNRAPNGIPEELRTPDPRNGPLKHEFKALLDKSLGRDKNGGPDAA